MLDICSGNVKSQLETVIEHLVGSQGQPGGAQVNAMHLSNRKWWSQDLYLPRPHLRFGSRAEGILLEIPAYLRPSEGKQPFFLCFCVHSCCSWAYPLLLRPTTSPPCYYCCAFCSTIVLQGFFSLLDPHRIFAEAIRNLESLESLENN